MRDRLDFARELVPNARLIAFIINPHNRATPAQVQDIQAAAAAFEQKIVVVNASTPEEVDVAFETMASWCSIV